MKLAHQPAPPNLRAKPAHPNVSTCAQFASIDSAIVTFRTLSKNCRVASARLSKFFRHRSSDAKRHANKPFRMNTCESVSKQRTLTTFRINTYENQGGRGVCNTPRRASAVTCATWRFYLLCPQSIAHTSCHHGGVPPTCFRFLCVCGTSAAGEVLFFLGGFYQEHDEHAAGGGDAQDAEELGEVLA